MLEKLKKLFQVDSTFQLFVIFVVFAITGSLSVVLGETVLLKFFGKDFVNNNFFWPLRLILIFPIYQILLIIVGTIFGQFKYFWKIEKKILIKMGLIKSSGS